MEYRWARKEANRLGLRITRSDLRRAYRREVRAYGRKALRRMFRRTGQRHSDFRANVYSFEYYNRLRRYVLATTRTRDEQATLEAFADRFRMRWRARTRCRPAFFVASVCR